jgi:hypothetical protein
MRLAAPALSVFAYLAARASAAPFLVWQLSKAERGCKSTYLQCSIIVACLLSAGSSTAEIVGPRTISAAEAIVIDFIEVCMANGVRIDFSAQRGRDYGMVDETDGSLEELPSRFIQGALLKNVDGSVYLRTAFVKGTGPALCQITARSIDVDQRRIAIGLLPVMANLGEPLAYSSKGPIWRADQWLDDSSVSLSEQNRGEQISDLTITFHIP